MSFNFFFVIVLNLNESVPDPYNRRPPRFPLIKLGAFSTFIVGRTLDRLMYIDNDFLGECCGEPTLPA